MFVLPATLKEMGLVSGVIAIVFFGLWSNWTQLLLIRIATSYKPPIYSYEDLAERVFGKSGKFFLAFFTGVTVFLGNAAHMKTVVSLLSDILEYFVTGSYGGHALSSFKKLILYFLLLAVALVKSADSRINQLRYISSASVGMVLLTCTWTTAECLFWYWPQGTHAFPGGSASRHTYEPVILMSDDWRVYAADLPAVAFAFSGTFCLFPVYAEMTDKSYSNVKKTVGLSTLVCCAGYAVVAVVGVLTFGQSVDRNPLSPVNSTDKETFYLYRFPPNHYIVTLLSFGLVCTITLLYAVINFPFLNAVEEISDIFGLDCLCGKHWLRHRKWRLIV